MSRNWRINQMKNGSTTDKKRVAGVHLRMEEIIHSQIAFSKWNVCVCVCAIEIFEIGFMVSEADNSIYIQNQMQPNSNARWRRHFTVIQLNDVDARNWYTRSQTQLNWNCSNFARRCIQVTIQKCICIYLFAGAHDTRATYIVHLTFLAFYS